MPCQYCDLNIRAHNLVTNGTFCGICSRQVYGFEFPFNQVTFDVNKDITKGTIICDFNENNDDGNGMIATSLGMTFHKNICNKQPDPEPIKKIDLENSSASINVRGLGSINANLGIQERSRKDSKQQINFYLKLQFSNFLPVALSGNRTNIKLEGEIVLCFGKKIHRMPLLINASKESPTPPLQATGNGNDLYLWRQEGDSFDFTAVFHITATAADIILDPSRDPEIEFSLSQPDDKNAVNSNKFRGRFKPKSSNRKSDCLVKAHGRAKNLVFDIRIPESLVDAFNLRSNENLELNHSWLSYKVTLPTIGPMNPFTSEGTALLRNKTCKIDANCDLSGEQVVYLGDELHLQFTFEENEAEKDDDFVPDITITSVVLAPNNYQLTQIDQYNRSCFEIKILDKDNNPIGLGDTAAAEHNKPVTANVTLKSTSLRADDHKDKQFAIIVSYHSNDCIEHQKIIMVSFKPYGVIDSPISIDWGTCNTVATLRRRQPFGNITRVETLPIGRSPESHIIPTKILFTDLRDSENPVFKLIDDRDADRNDIKVISQFKPEFYNTNARIYTDNCDPPGTAEYTFRQLAVFFIHRILSNLELHLKRRIAKFSCTFPTKWPNKASDMLHGVLEEVSGRLAKGNGGLVTPEVIKPTVDEASACVLTTIDNLSSNMGQEIVPFTALAIDIGGGTTDTAIVQIQPGGSRQQPPRFKFLGFGGLKDFAGTDITKRMAAKLCLQIIEWVQEEASTGKTGKAKGKGKAEATQAPKGIWIPTSLLEPPSFVNKLQNSDPKSKLMIEGAKRFNDFLLFDFAEKLKRIETADQNIKVMFDNELVDQLFDLLDGTVFGVESKKEDLGIDFSGIAVLSEETNSAGSLDKVFKKVSSLKTIEKNEFSPIAEKILISLNELLDAKIPGFLGHHPQLTINEILHGICREVQHLLQVHDHHANQENPDDQQKTKVNFIYFAGGTTKSKLIRKIIEDSIQNLEIIDPIHNNVVENAKKKTDELNPKVLVAYGLSWYLMRISQFRDLPIQFAKGCAQYPIVITDSMNYASELRILSGIGTSTLDGLKFDLELTEGILIEDGEWDKTRPLSVMTWDIMEDNPMKELGFFDFSHDGNTRLSSAIRRQKNSKIPLKGRVRYDASESNFILAIEFDGSNWLVPLAKANTYLDSISLLHLQ